MNENPRAEQRRCSWGMDVYKAGHAWYHTGTGSLCVHGVPLPSSASMFEALTRPRE